MGFFTIYSKKQFKSGVNALRDAVVSFDPETAGEVAIAEMEEMFDDANRQYSDAKRVYKKENGDVVKMNELYDERLAKAQKIQAKIDEGEDNPAFTTALDDIVGKLEDMGPDLEHEKLEAQDAKGAMDELKEVVDMYATKVKSARRDVKKIANQMKRSKRQEEMAGQREERARMKAGLTTGLTGMGSVLESMNRQAEEAEANAETANRKADLLGDSNIDADLDALLSEPVTKKSSADRLAALRR
jgi:chromosome segregation ATPase